MPSICRFLSCYVLIRQIVFFIQRPRRLCIIVASSTSIYILKLSFSLFVNLPDSPLAWPSNFLISFYQCNLFACLFFQCRDYVRIRFVLHRHCRHRYVNSDFLLLDRDFAAIFCSFACHGDCHSEKMWRSCRVVSCRVRRVMSCHVMSCHVISSRVVSCHVASCRVVSYHGVSRRGLRYWSILCEDRLRNATDSSLTSCI
jgi:hypothetical protein